MAFIFPPEMTLAAACCARQRDRVEACPTGGIDVAEFQRVVRRHRVAGLVERGLRSTLGAFPREYSWLVDAARQQTIRSMFTIASLQNIARAFAKAEVSYVLLKGPALSAMAYGDALVRHSKDLDLLVSPWDVPRASDILSGLGYVRTYPTAEMSGTAYKRWMRFAKHSTFVHAESKAEVELHWRIADNTRLFPLRISSETVADVRITEHCAVPSLHGDSLVLYLCSHGASHAWFRMKWLADVQALLSGYDQSALERLARTAKRYHLERPLLQAMDLIEDLFDIDIAYKPARSRHRNALLAVARDALLGENDPKLNPQGSTPISLSQFRLKRSPAFKVEEAVRQLIGNRAMKGSSLKVALVDTPQRLRILARRRISQSKQEQPGKTDLSGKADNQHANITNN